MRPCTWTNTEAEAYIVDKTQATSCYYLNSGFLLLRRCSVAELLFNCSFVLSCAPTYSLFPRSRSTTSSISILFPLYECESDFILLHPHLSLANNITVLRPPSSSLVYAQALGSESAMPSVTDLPCELVGKILSNLDHLRHLPAALLTCRHFYASFKETHGVEASILRHQVTPSLLPIAVALLEAPRLPRPLDASSIISLLDEPHSQPTRLAARVRPCQQRSCGRWAASTT